MVSIQHYNSGQSMSREQTALAVLHAMTRFPLVLEILSELGNSTAPNPGDDDIRHGCQRAIEAILVDLSRIEPAVPGNPSEAEAETCRLIGGNSGEGLIHSDQLQRIHEFIDHIFGQQGRVGLGGDCPAATSG